MEKAVHLANDQLGLLTPAGRGIALDKRRLGRSPETIKDLLTVDAQQIS